MEILPQDKGVLGESKAGETFVNERMDRYS
jgi:hypothetical protein